MFLHNACIFLVDSPLKLYNSLIFTSDSFKSELEFIFNVDL